VKESDVSSVDAFLLRKCLSEREKEKYFRIYIQEEEIYSAYTTVQKFGIT